MARFGRDFVRAATQPAYLEGLFTAAKDIGSLPARAQAQQESLQKYKDISKVVSQGDVSARSGDPRGLNIAINNLQQRLQNAKSVDEAVAITAQINKLKNQTTIAEQREETKNTSAVSIIDAELAKLSKEDDLYTVLSQRKEELLRNPEVASNYRKNQTDRWRYETAQRNQKDAAWIRTNAAAIEEAMFENDAEGLNKIIEGAGEFSQAAKTYVGIAEKSVNARKKMLEISIERTTEPDFDFYQDQIDSIPGSGEQLQPLLDRYRRVVETAWNGKEWSQPGLIAAKRLEKTLQGQINSLLNISNAQNFAAVQQVQTDEAAAVEELIRDIEAPVREEDVTREAQAIANKRSKRGKRGIILPEDREEARTLLRKRRNDDLLESLNRLNPEEAVSRGFITPSKETVDDTLTPTEEMPVSTENKTTRINDAIRLLEGGSEKAKENGEYFDWLQAYAMYGNPERAREELEKTPVQREQKGKKQGRFIVEEI